MLVKVINIIFALLFSIAAGLQYNDPDPYIWIPLYAVPAILCILAAAYRFYPRLYITVIILAGMYAAYFFFVHDGVLDWIQQHNADDIAQTMKAATPWIERTREFFGLLVIILSQLLNYYFAERRKKIIAL